MRNLYPEYISLLESLHVNAQHSMINSIRESVAEDSGLDPEYLLPDIPMESSIKKELDYLEVLDQMIVKKNKEILLLCSEAVLSKHPIGLSLDMIAESDIKSVYESRSNTLMGSLKTAMESGDNSKVCGFTRCVSDRDCEVMTAMKASVCCGKGVKDSLDCIFITECDKPVTKECVKEALAFLEKGCSEKIKEVKKIADEKCKSYKEKVCRMKDDMDDAAKVVHGQCKKNEACKSQKTECKNEAVNACFAVASYMMEQDFIDRSYIVSLENQILELNNQARKIVMCTYDYNPRDYAASLPVVKEMAEAIEEQSNEFYDALWEMDNTDIVNEAGIKTMFQNLKDKLTKSNKKFLDRYEKKALASECKGLVMEEWYVFVDLDKKYSDTLKSVKDLFKGSDIDDEDELKKMYKDLKDKGLGLIPGKVAKTAADFTRKETGDSFALYSKIAVNTTRNHSITKQDVKDAIATLKNISTEIDDAFHDLNKNVVALNSIYAFQRRSGNTGLTKSEKYQRKLGNLKKDYLQLLDKDYSGAVYWQLLAKQKQARKVVQMAARDSSNEWASVFDEELAEITESVLNYI